ncbi:MAG: aminotransferase class I/II-fold pyridoxal phosphate-dependent enzyme [Myxococcota bacterium]
MKTLDELTRRHEALRAEGLDLDMRRGQPSDADFDLSNPLLSAVGPDDIHSEDGFDVRNYPGGPLGLVEIRRVFAALWGVDAERVMVRNNASLELMAQVLMWARLVGVGGAPWGEGARLMVTVPGYDRHFTLLAELGFELETVPMTADGPDPEAVAAAAKDPAVKGMLFVPNYSNPSGEVLSEAVARQLLSVDAAAPDFTMFADDAYRIHHLGQPPVMVELLGLARELGVPDRIMVFGSTSKVTFASGGLGFVMANDTAWLEGRFSATSIGPNKVEQLRHARFFRNYEGGVEALMRAHAALIAPKFAAVSAALATELGPVGENGLARWSEPSGGYFVTLWTERPVASRVVELAAELGVKLTPAGATHPGGVDPENRTLRLAPTRPPLRQVERAMEVVAHCVHLASAEHDAKS